MFRAKIVIVYVERIGKDWIGLLVVVLHECSKELIYYSFTLPRKSYGLVVVVQGERIKKI